MGMVRGMGRGIGMGMDKDGRGVHVALAQLAEDLDQVLVAALHAQYRVVLGVARPRVQPAGDELLEHELVVAVLVRVRVKVRVTVRIRIRVRVRVSMSSLWPS